MANIAPVTTNDAANNANKTGASTVKLAEDFQQFLTLLTTQLQNQDPLSPMDSTEFTNQLVQFAQVEQQINQNQKLDDLVALQLSSISSVALGYVGMDISYISSDMNYDGEKPVDITYALASEAVTSKINIYDEEGTLVYSNDAPKDTGMNSFTWNGIKTNGDPVPAGTYTVKIDAVDKEGKAIENSTVVTGRVKGIETQNGIVYVLVGERAVAISSIVNASQPGLQSGGGSSAALGYVGMDITYESDDLKYEGAPIEINYSLLEKASKSKINIYDDKGTLVYSADASRMPGASAHTWNGKKTDGSNLPNGNYTVKIEAVTTENKPVETSTFFYGHVEGVESKGGVNYVLTEDDRMIPVSDIINARKPTTETA